MKRQKRASKQIACKRKRPRFSNTAEQRAPEYVPRPHAPEIVKGTSRRVVVVHPEDEETLFEQIIYVVRDDALSRPGVSAEEVLGQAAAAVRPKGAARAPLPEKRRCRLTAALLWLTGIALVLAVGICAYWFLY